MFQLPFILSAYACGVASKVAAHQAAERARLGLPPIELPKPTPEEIAKDKRDDRICCAMMIAWLFVGALFYAAPIVGLVYVAIKLIYAAHGHKFP